MELYDSYQYISPELKSGSFLTCSSIDKKTGLNQPVFRYPVLYYSIIKM